MNQTYGRNGLREAEAATARTSGTETAGLQATPETSTGASRLIVAVCELLPRDAVTVAL